MLKKTPRGEFKARRLFLLQLDTGARTAGRGPKPKQKRQTVEGPNGQRVRVLRKLGAIAKAESAAAAQQGDIRRAFAARDKYGPRA